MKHPTGYAPPRRRVSPKKQVRLDLRRSAPPPDDDLGTRRKSHFWRWVSLVALLHLVAIGLFCLLYEGSPPPPPEPFMSLLPPGDVVKGTAGTQEAPKLGPTTPAPSVQHSAPPPAAIQPPPKPTPRPAPPKPILTTDAPPLVPNKPTPPKPPKVKIDLSQLVDGPATATDKPKPKPHLTKPVTPAHDSNAPDHASASNPDSTGLSKEQIAAKLGDKMKAAGVADSVKIGPSGSDHSQANPFAEFYDSLRDQAMSKWEYPNLDDETAVNPEVMIHVEKDGRVPPESVTLQRSSGNKAYDDSALAAAKNLGYTLEPLPDGCPPDISITFKLKR